MPKNRCYEEHNDFAAPCNVYQYYLAANQSVVGHQLIWVTFTSMCVDIIIGLKQFCNHACKIPSFCFVFTIVFTEYVFVNMDFLCLLTVRNQINYLRNF